MGPVKFNYSVCLLVTSHKSVWYSQPRQDFWKGRLLIYVYNSWDVLCLSCALEDSVIFFRLLLDWEGERLNVCQQIQETCPRNDRNTYAAGSQNYSS